MSDSRTPAKTDSAIQPPPIPPRPKSALKSKIMVSTPKPPHKRTKSDPSPSPGKKINQQNGVRIDALSPAKKGHVQRSLKIDFEEEAKHGSDSLFFSPSRTPKPKNVPSIIAKGRPVSFSGRVAALLLAYDVYGHDPNPDTLWQYEQELNSFGFSCPKDPVRKDEGDDEWQKRLEQHKDEVSCHSDYYLLHSDILRKAKGQKSLDQKDSPAAVSPSPQKIVLEQSTAKCLSPAVNVPQQTNPQRSPVTTFDEKKTQVNGDYQFNTPQKVVSDMHSINGDASQKPPLPKASSKGFWSFCPCGKAEEEEDDMRYSQLPDGPVAKQMQ